MSGLMTPAEAETKFCPMAMAQEEIYFCTGEACRAWLRSQPPRPDGRGLCGMMPNPGLAEEVQELRRQVNNLLKQQGRRGRQHGK
jgi:hypothetical protein